MMNQKTIGFVVLSASLIGLLPVCGRAQALGKSLGSSAAMLTAVGLAVPAPDDAPLVGEGRAAPTQDDPETIIGTFESQNGPLMWQLRDAPLASSGVLEQFKKLKKGALDIGAALKALKAGWVMTRDMEGVPYYVFFDAGAQGVLYVPIQSIRLRGAELARTGSSASGDSLHVVYGTREAGAVVSLRMSRDQKQLTATEAVIDYTDGSLAEGLVYSGEGLDLVLQDPALRPLAERLGQGGGESPSARERMRSFLSEGGDRSILVQPAAGGKVVFKLQESQEDKSYIYASAASVREYKVR